MNISVSVISKHAPHHIAIVIRYALEHPKRTSKMKMKNKKKITRNSNRNGTSCKIIKHTEKYHCVEMQKHTAIFPLSLSLQFLLLA